MQNKAEKCSRVRIVGYIVILILETLEIEPQSKIRSKVFEAEGIFL